MAEEIQMPPAKKGGALSLASMSQKALLDDITTSITKQVRASTFSCGGSVPIKSDAQDGALKSFMPIEICVGDSGSDNTKFTLPIKDGYAGGIEALLAACSPASFGRDGQDVFDESYRRAMKLDTEKFLTSFCPYTTGIMDVVAQLLLPNAVGGEPRGVKAELYKLNVYSAPSGMFKAHVDTPRSASQIGSLVVCLPFAHSGGELVIRSGGKDVVFDWSSNSTDTEPVIQWAAFYSDCEHEVLEVKSGHRITLTYNLYAVTPATGLLAGNAGALLNPSQLPLYQPLKIALDTPSFLERGRILGIWLKHSYAHSNNALNNLPSSLKGVDMAMYETARALGLACVVRPILQFNNYDPKHNDYGTITRIGKSFQELTTFDYSEPDYYEDEEESDEYQSLAESMRSYFESEPLDEGKISWLNRSDHGEPALTYTGASGNEAPCRDIYYTSVALLIQIPPFKDRGNGTEASESMFHAIEADEDQGEGGSGEDNEGDSDD